SGDGAEQKQSDRQRYITALRCPPGLRRGRRRGVLIAFGALNEPPESFVRVPLLRMIKIFRVFHIHSFMLALTATDVRQPAPDARGSSGSRRARLQAVSAGLSARIEHLEALDALSMQAEGRCCAASSLASGSVSCRE